ncbi:MAG: hypothetical protein ACK5MA_03090 [Parachlamydiaceae bacterium]
MERLELFFEDLIKYSTLGYSLCGDKPVSVEHVPQLTRVPIFLATTGYFKYSWYSIIGLGWDCWMKYAERFPSSNYCLRTSDDLHAIILINKKASLNAISENIDLFQKYLKTNKTPIELLEELCHSEPCMILDSHPVLMGILYGFGRNNSIAFANAGHGQPLKFFNQGTLYIGLSDHFGVGFRTLSDESNFKENNFLRTQYQTTKKKLRCSFHGDKYFEQFLYYYSNSADPKEKTSVPKRSSAS